MDKTQPSIVCLSSFFSTDRILLYSSLLDHLPDYARPVVWSYAHLESSFESDQEHVRYFEKFFMDHSIPYRIKLLRQLVDYVWDRTMRSTSRESFWHVRKSKETTPQERLMYALAGPLSWLRLGPWLERLLSAVIIKFGKNKEVLEHFQKHRPAAILAMCPFSTMQMGIVAVAKALQIPVFAFITSFDNITTKNRLIFEYDGYIAWSEQMKRELHEYYPATKAAPVYVVGAPQFDVFMQDQYLRTRKEFMQGCGLDPGRPLVVYCLGSPNLIREDHGALQFLQRLRGPAQRPDIQVILRLHPGFKEAGCTELDRIKAEFPDVVIQGPHRHWTTIPYQSSDSVVEWVNTLRHADVVVNLSSTMAVDASIFDKPVVNLDYDPEPGGPNQQLVKEINHKWVHFRPIAESGGVWLVNNPDELVAATLAYLKDPSLHAAQRRWIVEFVCQQVDGNSGRRFAEALGELMGRSVEPSLVRV